MNPENLVNMANQIGMFFETMPDRQQALRDLANHFKRYWEPRMRHSLLQYIDEHGADGHLKDMVLEAVRMHPASLL